MVFFFFSSLLVGSCLRTFHSYHLIPPSLILLSLVRFFFFCINFHDMFLVGYPRSSSRILLWWLCFYYFLGEHLILYSGENHFSCYISNVLLMWLLLVPLLSLYFLCLYPCSASSLLKDLHIYNCNLVKLPFIDIPAISPTHLIWILT